MGKVQRMAQWVWEVPCVPWVCPENTDWFLWMVDGRVGTRTLNCCSKRNHMFLVIDCHTGCVLTVKHR